MPLNTPNYNWPFPKREENLTDSIGALTNFSVQSDNAWNFLKGKMLGYPAILDDAEEKIFKPTYIKAPQLPEDKKVIQAGTKTTYDLSTETSRYGQPLTYTIKYPDGTVLENQTSFEIDALTASVGDTLEYEFFSTDGIQVSNETTIIITVVATAPLEVINATAVQDEVDETLWHLTFEITGGTAPYSSDVSFTENPSGITKISETAYDIWNVGMTSLDSTITVTDYHGEKVVLLQNIPFAIAGINKGQFWSIYGGNTNQPDFFGPPFHVDADGNWLLQLYDGPNSHIMHLVKGDLSFDENLMKSYRYPSLELIDGYRSISKPLKSVDGFYYCLMTISGPNTGDDKLYVGKFSADFLEFTTLEINLGFGAIGAQAAGTLGWTYNHLTNGIIEIGDTLYMTAYTGLNVMILVKFNKTSFTVDRAILGSLTADSGDDGWAISPTQDGTGLWWFIPQERITAPNNLLFKLDLNLNIVEQWNIPGANEEATAHFDLVNNKMYYYMTGYDLNLFDGIRDSLVLGHVNLSDMTFSEQYINLVGSAFTPAPTGDPELWAAGIFYNPDTNKFLLTGDTWGNVGNAGGETWFHLQLDADTLDFEWGFGVMDTTNWCWIYNYSPVGMNWLAGGGYDYNASTPFVFAFDGPRGTDGVISNIGVNTFEYTAIDGISIEGQNSGSLAVFSGSWNTGYSYYEAVSFNTTPEVHTGVESTLTDLKTALAGATSVSGQLQ